MQTNRHYDPTQDAKFNVSIATTEEICRKWTTPMESLRRPRSEASDAETARGLSESESAPEVPEVTNKLKITQVGGATIGLSTAF